MHRYITPDMVEQARRSIPLRLGPLGETIIRRTYARPKPDGGLEDWYDICARVVNGNCNLVDPRFIEPGEPEQLFHLMVTLQLIPAGRHLWATGIHKYRQFVNNCFVSDFTEQFSKHFTYTFLRLMEGGGVGANYSNRFIHSNPNGGFWVPRTKVNLHFICPASHPDIGFPIEPEPNEELPGSTLKDLLSTKYPADYEGGENGSYLRVEDSREGWAEALEKLLEFHMGDRGEMDFVIDIGNIRPYGAELKGFGGKASGPTALVLMLYRINRLLNGLIGQPLRSLHYMEIDHRIAQAVIAGGTRRSARMAMKWWEDEDIMEFIQCKRDYWLHWTTNISVVVGNEFFRAIRNSRHPKHEWAHKVLDAVVEGMLTNGEPGLINASQCEVDEAPGATFYSTNPCVVGDTAILTNYGVDVARNLVGQPFQAVVRGETYHSEGFFETGTKPVYELVTKEGSRLQTTADHLVLVETGNGEAWTAVADLQVGQEVVISGTLMEDYLRIAKEALAWFTQKSVHSSTGFKAIWLDETDPRKPWEWKSLFNMIGVPSILEYRPKQQCWSLRISNADLNHVKQFIRKCQSRKTKTSPYTRAWTETVAEVRPIGEQPVFDCNIDTVHCYISNGFISHNCGEIPMMRYPDMKAFDVCCLGHVNLAFAEDPAVCFRLMARFLLRATFAELADPLTKQNVERNRRIGVGFLGFHEWLAKQGIRYSEASSNQHVARQLRRFRAIVQEEARRYAHQMRIPEPIKKTTVAPTGTINNIPGVTSGIQPLYSPFYIRRVRYSNSDEELEKVLKRGDFLSAEPDLYAANTTVVSYVYKDSTVDRVAQHFGGNIEKALSVLESQFECDIADFLRVQELVQRDYADNAVSITINIPPQSQNPERLKELLLLYLPKLKGVTLFPEQSRPQAPLEAITYEQYLQAQQKQVGSYDIECQNNACPVR